MKASTYIYFFAVDQMKEVDQRSPTEPPSKLPNHRYAEVRAGNILVIAWKHKQIYCRISRLNQI